jgi:hypothetical protein
LSNCVGGISVVLVVCVVFVRLLVDVVGCCVAWILSVFRGKHVVFGIII